MELKIKGITKNESGLIITYEFNGERKDILLKEFLNEDEENQAVENLKIFFEYILPKLANKLFK